MNPQVALILQGLREGRINEQEADMLLRAEHGTSLEALQPRRHPQVHKSLPALSIALVLIALVTGMFLFSQGTITGFVARDTHVIAGYSQLIPVNDSLTQLKATGMLIGEGNGTVWLNTSSGMMLVARISSDDGSPRTLESSYSFGDMVEMGNIPQGASIYLQGETTEPVDLPFPAPAQNGTILVIVNDSGSLVTYDVPLIIGDVPRTTRFDSACEDTCSLNGTSGSLRIDVSPGALLDVHLLAQTQEANHAPIATSLPSVRVNSTVTIDLADYFTDPDGDELFYSTSTSQHASLAIEGSVLTLSPLSDGEENITIYSSDLTELVQATMRLQVQVPLRVSVANVTENGTSEPAPPNGSVTLIDVPNVTIVPTQTAALNCSNPDINQRPVACLQEEPKNFEEDVFLENEARVRVARISPIGNLLITGTVIEASSGSPQAGAFTIGYMDDQTYVPTIWIDAEGDLHLRGHLFEEDTHVVPESGDYAIINHRGIYLARADQRSGDLYLRGNLIPYRRSVDS